MSEKAALVGPDDGAASRGAPAPWVARSSNYGLEKGRDAAEPRGHPPASSSSSSSRKAGAWKRGGLLLLGLAAAYKLLLGGKAPAERDQAAACPQVPPLVPPHDARLDEVFWTRLARNASSAAYERQAAEALRALVRYPTVSISYDLPAQELRNREAAFKGLHAELERRYPLVHKHFAKDVVADFSLLYFMKGSDSSLPPIMLAAHLDVVPVDPSTLDEWRFDPFSGKIAEGYVWGRGTSDDKLPLTAIFESLELLLASGFTSPRRGIVVALGHDEEVGGNAGARAISKYMAEVKNIRKVALLVDEGKAILEVKTDAAANLQPRESQPPEGDDGGYTPVALIGVAEKGAVDVYLDIETRGGHSSNPPAHTSVGLMSILISRIEAEQFPPGLVDENPTVDSIECLASHLDLSNLPVWDRVMLHNVRSLKSVVAAYVSSKLPAVAMNFHTTTAVTMMNGGVKANVLPPTTSAVINFRIAVESSVEEVVGKIQEIAATFAEEFCLDLDAKGPLARKYPAPGKVSGKLALSVAGIREPSPVSPHTSSAFRVLAGTTRHVFGRKAVVTPALMTANSDTIHYWDKTRNIFRFEPYIPGREHARNYHDVDEAANIKSLVSAVAWYFQFVRNAMELVDDF